MKHLTLIVLILFFQQSVFSQTVSENVRQAYIIAFGTTATSKEIQKMQNNAKLDVTTVSKTVEYFNAYIFNNRKTIQKDIIRRAYFSVFNKYPNSQNIEDMYATTKRKSKNFTDFTQEFKTYFKDGISEPE